MALFRVTPAFPPMSDESPKFGPLRRRRTLQSARRRLKRVEIETHRIEAELALLESANEHVIANVLTDELRQGTAAGLDLASDRPAEAAVRGWAEELAETSPEPGDHDFSSLPPTGNVPTARRRATLPRN